MVSQLPRSGLATTAALGAFATVALARPAEVQINLCSEPATIVKGLEPDADRPREVWYLLARAGVAVCADQSSQAGAKLRALVAPRR